MATHHTSTPHHVDASPAHHETPSPHPTEPRPVREPHATAGGHGGGYAVHTDSLGTMEGHLGRTKEKVHAVGQTVAGANFGAKSMGVVGAGMTGTLNGTVSAAKEHVARAGKAVEDAGTRTKAVREHYKTTEANSASTIAAAGKQVDAPKPAAPHSPGGGGGGMDNNHGHHASDDELRGQYTRESMQTRPTSTDNQIRDAASRLGYDPDQHLAMTLQPTADLTPAQRAEIVAVRNELRADPGEIMSKVVKPEMGEATLGNETTYVDRHTGKTETNYPTSVAGSIARGSDSAQYGTPQEFRDKLALDDKGAGWTPIKAGAGEAYQLRFPALDERVALEISYGGTDPVTAHDMQSLSGQPGPRELRPPFLGTGYTGGGVPEWMHAPRGYAGRGEMWLVHADGTESLAGVYLEKRGWFDVRGRGGSGG